MTPILIYIPQGILVDERLYASMGSAWSYKKGRIAWATGVYPPSKYPWTKVPDLPYEYRS